MLFTYRSNIDPKVLLPHSLSFKSAFVGVPLSTKKLAVQKVYIFVQSPRITVDFSAQMQQE